ncbi:hypothetical protein JB92DRAFT_1207717 [Gautieria morchelliformis]|nr:hypothetical protein JB92DRAFT_1207717 [Gautieria morchelliformis]
MVDVSDTPMHVLAIYVSTPADQMASITLHPVHAIVLIAHCANLALSSPPTRAPSASPFPCTHSASPARAHSSCSWDIYTRAARIRSSWRSCIPWGAFSFMLLFVFLSCPSFSLWSLLRFLCVPLWVLFAMRALFGCSLVTSNPTRVQWLVEMCSLVSLDARLQSLLSSSATYALRDGKLCCECVLLSVIITSNSRDQQHFGTHCGGV